MGLYIRDKIYPKPFGLECPEKEFTCHHCGTPSDRFKGVWDEYTGKWYYRFTCKKCGAGLTKFWLDPRAKVKNTKKAYVPGEDPVDE